MTQHIIYTSRNTAGNLGATGWSAVIEDPKGKIQKLSGGSRNSTRNHMEVTAVVHGIEATPKKAKVKIYIHSKYIQNAVTSWMERWKANYWRASRSKKLPDRELWVRLDEAMQTRSVSWVWQPPEDAKENKHHVLCQDLATEKMEEYRRK